MRFFAIIFAVLIIFTSLTQPILSQTTERKKPKIRNFGSSLERKTEIKVNAKREKQIDTQDEDVIKIDTNIVVLDCLVADAKGKVITGLKPEDFKITEDNQPQEIQTFTLGNDAKIPRSIVLVIDYSGSQKPYIERSVEAAKLLVDKLRQNDLMAIVTDDVEIISQFTSDKNKLKKELNSLKKNGFFSPKVGASKQFSALYAVLNEMFDETDVRPIIIFQTDGDELPFLSDQFGDLIYPQQFERKTNFSTDELFEMTKKSRASIYSVFVGAKLLGLSEAEKKQKSEIERERWAKYWGVNLDKIRYPTPQRQERMNQEQARIKKYYPNGFPDPQEFMSILSEQTGGWLAFLEEPEQADGIYTRILAELNTRYIIGFTPTNDAKDGRRRTVKVEVKNHPEYSVWGRKTYIPKPLDY